MLPGRGTPGRENTATNGRVTLEIQAISPIRIPPITPTSTAAPASFEGILGQALQGLAATQARADSQAADLAAGKDVSLVDTVLAMEQSSLSFNLAMQVRDKVIGAYQDVMRMQF